MTAAATSAAAIAVSGAFLLSTGSAGAAEPVTTLHNSPNGNFSGTGAFTPGAAGFNVADVSSTSVEDSLPTGVKGLVWVGTCAGADTTFKNKINSYASKSNVFGFYLMDDPDPTGQYHPLCSAANLKAESDYVHTKMPGAKTFVNLMNMASSKSPSYMNTYKPSNSGVDLYGLGAYPCRTALNGCDYTYITKAVSAAQTWGIPTANIVPVYQTFGGGTWSVDDGGSYMMPTATQLQTILNTWGSVVPNPVFDQAYSWGVQNGDTALFQSPELQTVMQAHNKPPAC